MLDGELFRGAKKLMPHSLYRKIFTVALIEFSVTGFSVREMGEDGLFWWICWCMKIQDGKWGRRDEVGRLCLCLMVFSHSILTSPKICKKYIFVSLKHSHQHPFANLYPYLLTGFRIWAFQKASLFEFFSPQRTTAFSFTQKFSFINSLMKRRDIPFAIEKNYFSHKSWLLTIIRYRVGRETDIFPRKVLS